MGQSMPLKDSCQEKVRGASWRHRGHSLNRWHVTDIAWPPLESPARQITDTNLEWLQQHPRCARVSDNVNAMDILGYCECAGFAASEVVLCIWVGAHGRNYHPDSDDMHEVVKGFGWSKRTFVDAAFGAVCGQLPRATVLFVGRQWEGVSMQLAHRPVICSRVSYSAVRGGERFVPEGSTRFERYHLPGGMALGGVAALGPDLRRYACGVCTRGLPLDVPKLVLRASATGGVVLFLGEYTAAHARHCAEFIDERPLELAYRRQCSLWRARLSSCWLPLAAPASPQDRLLELRRHPCDRKRPYSYEEFKEHVRQNPKNGKHFAFLVAHMWNQSYVVNAADAAPSGDQMEKRQRLE
mmetsp:Transcript_56127/g.135548  ORF Transcript_56127/g.135548 Transcript_56127/m.135548 type:complete len:354 (-) Transcript_56127:59-1120(-)